MRWQRRSESYYTGLEEIFNSDGWQTANTKDSIALVARLAHILDVAEASVKLSD